MDITNYSKKAMEDLATSMVDKRNAYLDLINSVEKDIKAARESWVEGDENAEAVYNSLVNEFNEFKKNLQEGADLMTEFYNTVNGQIEKYREAENKVQRFYH